MLKRSVRGNPTSSKVLAATESPTAVMEPPPAVDGAPTPVQPGRKMHSAPTPSSTRYTAVALADEHGANRQAELFYLQKQIQLQTQMVFILEDGSRVQGVIEWYDRNSIKVRGKSRMLVYKSAIKYLYKAGEVGSAPED
jgi:sRNA-binding regulator protein Hfq